MEGRAQSVLALVPERRWNKILMMTAIPEGVKSRLLWMLLLAPQQEVPASLFYSEKPQAEWHEMRTLRKRKLGPHPTWGRAGPARQLLPSASLPCFLVCFQNWLSKFQNSVPLCGSEEDKYSGLKELAGPKAREGRRWAVGWDSIPHWPRPTEGPTRPQLVHS